MKKEPSSKKNDFHQQIEHFLEDKFTEEELRNIIKWYTESKYQVSLHQVLSKIWSDRFADHKDDLGKEHMEKIRGKVHHRINIQRCADEKHPALSTKLMVVLSRVAAVLFIPLMVFSILYFREGSFLTSKDEAYTEISVPEGSKLKTQLPDGSVVWVNSGSILRYPQKFTKRKRIAELSGEAYFNITTDPSHPFIVRTDKLDINAIGTSFNVMAYPEFDYISATLEHGTISIEEKITDKKNSHICLLEPGHRMVYHKSTKVVNSYRTDTEKYTSWKEGRLIFRNDPLNVVIHRLAKWYHADIVLVDSTHGLPDHPFSITIMDETLPQVLDYLSIAAPIEWKSIPTKRSETGRIITSRYIISNK